MTSQSSEALNNTDSVPVVPVAVPSRANRRLYEAILLLRTLNQICRSTERKQSNDLLYGTEHDTNEEVFRNFVCRLGQICDSRPGGSTVTAFTVLKHPDKVEFVFGSNMRRPVDLAAVKGYITSIISTLRKAPSWEDETGRAAFVRELLRDILTFNRDRVKRYLNGLANALKACTEICSQETASQGLSRRTMFAELLELVQLANRRDTDDDEYFEYAENTMVSLQRLQQPNTNLFIRQKATNERAGNTEPWRELQHFSGRLLAYQRAVDVLWLASNMWPELFDNFVVTPISSSTKAANPLLVDPQTSLQILGRWLNGTNDPDSGYQDLAKELQQKSGLDEAIRAEWTDKSFRPIVHAEVLVLNWLETNGGTKPERFFETWRYIGSSKPTCKLCHQYFSCHSSRVQVRGTHGNLYRNWRMPDNADIYGLDETSALEKRHEIMQLTTGHLRQDVLRILKEKVPGGQRYDSNTLSSFPLNRGQRALSDEMRDLVLTRARGNGSGGGAPSLSMVPEERGSAEDSGTDGQSTSSFDFAETRSQM